MIVKDEQRLVMEFIATVNRGGYRPTGREVNEWRLGPDPWPRTQGKLLDAAVSEIPERRIGKRPAFLQSMADPSSVLAGIKLSQTILDGIGKNYLNTINQALAGVVRESYLGGLGMGMEYETIPGRPGRPARYGPDKPAEKFLAHLRRLAWIERDKKGGYAVTRLGHALLRAEAATDSGDEDASVMVLAAEDELAYGRVLGVISDCGEALIMDGYLAENELVHILKDSSATRFLVSNKLKVNRLTQLAVMIRLTLPKAEGVIRELRRADFHDRYLIGEDRVYGLGSSLNGVGKSMTTLIQLPDLAAQTVRAEAEHLWAHAEVIAYTDEHIDLDESADKDATKDSPSGVSTVKKSFRHNGCSVRHRSQQAADKCHKGPEE